MTDAPSPFDAAQGGPSGVEGPPGPATPADVSATAREKYHCPACGGEAVWTPAKQALVCPFCGTVSPAKLEQRGADTVIVEHDLVATLRSIPDSERGWQAQKISVQCQSCRAISVFDPDKVARRCDFCGSTALVPYEQTKDVFRPESLLPFKISEPQARDAIRSWYGRQWLAPNRFRLKALTDTVKGIYLPYWTFDAKADADVDGRSWPLLLGAAGQPERAAGALDAGRGRALALFRRRPGVRVARRGRREASPRRAVPDGHPDSVRSRLSVRLDRRALSDRSRRRGAAIARPDEGASSGRCAPRRCLATRTATCA